MYALEKLCCKRAQSTGKFTLLFKNNNSFILSFPPNVYFSSLCRFGFWTWCCSVNACFFSDVIFASTEVPSPLIAWKWHIIITWTVHFSMTLSHCPLLKHWLSLSGSRAAHLLPFWRNKETSALWITSLAGCLLSLRATAKRKPSVEFRRPPCARSCDCRCPGFWASSTEITWHALSACKKSSGKA